MTTLAIREPSSLVEVHDQCASIEAWAEQCDSVAELRDANNKLAAIDEYLSRTSTEGRGRVAAAMRRLEVRIGQLLPREQGKRSDLLPNPGEEVLNDRQKAEFRRMAEHEDEVEEVLAASTDEAPATRKDVLGAIAERQPAAQPSKPKRTPLPDVAKPAGWEMRKAVERVERVFDDDRFTANREQVANHLRAHLIYVVGTCQLLLDQLDA